jgi:hypothetical protein
MPEQSESMYFKDFICMNGVYLSAAVRAARRD